jgi:hypothetical protein
MFLSWMTLSQVKTVTFGRFLGQKLDGDLIPQVYRGILESAKFRSESVGE